MRTPQSITAAMEGQESGNPKPQIENNENGNFRGMALPLAGGSLSVGGGIALNRVAADILPQTGPVYDPMATDEKEEEEKSKKSEQAPVAAVAENNNVSGVRKKLLIPAEEALDSARVTAELIMKDAMDALQRTKQRLMDILLPHSTSQAPPPAANEGSKINSEAVGADEADNQGSENVPSTEVVNIFSEPAMGVIFPLHRQPAAAVAVSVRSRL